MNPFIEQPDHYFLMYIQNKFKLLVQKDTTVSLLNDEIHLKPYFYYKDGNIVVLSDISNEAATCAFLFLCLVVYSHNIRMLCMLNQLNVLKQTMYLT